MNKELADTIRVKAQINILLCSNCTVHKDRLSGKTYYCLDEKRETIFVIVPVPGLDCLELSFPLNPGKRLLLDYEEATLGILKTVFAMQDDSDIRAYLNAMLSVYE